MVFNKNNAGGTQNGKGADDPVTAVGAMGELTAIFFNALVRSGLRRKEALHMTEVMYIWTFHNGGLPMDDVPDDYADDDDDFADD